jgi:RNA polymerase sigma factor (sigma-70 family)
MTPDAELLATFARTNSEDAFAELVKRHVNLIYSAALRQVQGDEHLAKDVAQIVFSDLARKAGSLARRESLTGWLYTSAHHAAAKVIRTETRRRDREEKFMRESDGSGTGIPPVQSADEQAEWENLRSMLDAAMHELKDTDREAILLRYFENRPFADVGAKLGLNENAARMRVERALEKLRAVFAKRGIAATSALAAVISANAVQLAPAGLATTLTTASIISAGTGTLTLMKILTATKLKLAASALVVAGATAVLVVQHQAQTRLNEENQSLRQMMTQLQKDDESFSNRVAASSSLETLPKDQFNELLKLRGEVGVLRQESANLSNRIVRASNPYGLSPETMPPVVSSSVSETASAYARLVKKLTMSNLTMSNLTAAEEFNLLKAWPYLEKRFPEPDSFAYFQSQYLSDMLNITNQDTVWQIRRLLEIAREQEHAQGLRWARLSDQELKHYDVNLDMAKIRAQWDDLNQKTIQKIDGILTEQEQLNVASLPWPVMDFDSRLKSASQPSRTDPRFQSLTSQEIFDAFFPPKPGVRFVPAKITEIH